MRRPARAGGSLADSARASLLPFFATRAIVLAALGLSRFLSGQLGLTGPAGIKAIGTSRAGLTAWDASWYLRVAEAGYSGAGHTSLRFFPLLPLAARVLGYLPGLSDRAALLLIVNLAGFAALVALHRLVSLEAVGESVAERSLWILSLWPAAFVLVMGYAEALLLLLSVLAFWCWRTGRWWWSLLPAFLAGLTRPVGVLLAVPALVEGLSWWRAGRRRLPETVLRAAGVLAAPAGAAAYLAWAAAAFGSFTAPLSEQLSPKHRGGVADPLVTLARDASDFVRGRHFGTALHAPFVVIFVALALYLFFRLPAAYGWYAVATLAVAVTAPNLDSLERYGLACFPLAVSAALLCANRSVERTVLAGLAAVLTGLATLAFLGLYVP
ncbi:MAG TPA: mannosyltransferase family protein [Acidimicrobiales bacterium]|nr:mannosyltransferase family protein [Acidimicrobiales bacterium]